MKYRLTGQNSVQGRSILQKAPVGQIIIIDEVSTDSRPFAHGASRYAATILPIVSSRDEQFVAWYAPKHGDCCLEFDAYDHCVNCSYA
jgi:hypothetical protein